jgi:hypothetical protein
MRDNAVMARFIKRFTRVGSIGPTEERGFAIWVGYDIAGVDDDLADEGLIRVDDWTDAQLAERGVAGFTPVTLEKLGIQRKR